MPCGAPCERWSLFLRDLPNHPQAGTAHEMAFPSGIDTECEHGLACPIKGKNQLLGTAARRYVPAWGMLCSLMRWRVVKRAGWPGELSEPSAGARHALMRALRREGLC